MNPHFNAIPFKAVTYEEIATDEYIGPGKKAVPFFELYVLGICIIAAAVVVRRVFLAWKR